MLCIPNDQRDAMHAELCGQIFKDAVNDALAAGERRAAALRWSGLVLQLALPRCAAALRCRVGWGAGAGSVSLQGRRR